MHSPRLPSDLRRAGQVVIICPLQRVGLGIAQRWVVGRPEYGGFDRDQGTGASRSLAFDESAQADDKTVDTSI